MQGFTVYHPHELSVNNNIQCILTINFDISTYTELPSDLRVTIILF